MKKIFLVLLFLTLFVGIATAQQLVCIPFKACVDGSDYITVANSQLSMIHRNYNPIGSHGDCANYPNFWDKINVNGIFYGVSNSPAYLIDGQPSLPVGIVSILSFVSDPSNRGVVSLGGGQLLIDDDPISSGAMYIIDLCGEPTSPGTPSPEFPTMVLPATMIIGFLGAVQLIRRTRET